MKNLKALLLACSLLMSTTDLASEKEPTFTFSADPGQRVLWIELIGGEEAGAATVYGDGRLEYIRESRDQTRLIEKATISLTYEEVRSLLAIALRSGLVEYDEKSLQKRMNDIATSRPPMSLYAGTTVIGFSLESLDDREDVKVEIVCKNVAGLTVTYPSIREYQGIDELTRRLFARWREVFNREAR